MRISVLVFMLVSLLFILSGIALSIDEESLVLYLSFDKTLEDSSTYKNNGEFKGGTPKWVDGQSGKALDFDGSSWLEIPDSDSLDLPGALTISLWLKWDGAGSNWSPFIAKRISAQIVNYNTWVGSDKWWDYANSVGKPHTDTPIPLDDEWIFLAVTHDGNITVSFYIDGSLDSSKTLATVEPNDSPLCVGQDCTGNIGAGTIDEVTIFNIALTAEEIKNVMEEGVLAVAGRDKAATTWGEIKHLQ